MESRTRAGGAERNQLARRMGIRSDPVTGSAHRVNQSLRRVRINLLAQIHYQGKREGDRARPRDRLWNREAKWRIYLGGKRNRQGKRVPNALAPCCATGWS